MIYFSINHSTESIERVVLPNNAIGNFYKTKEAAIADVKYNNSKGGSAGLAMFVTPVIFFNTRYILDFNGRVLEKSEGYFVGQKY